VTLVLISLSIVLLGTILCGAALVLVRRFRRPGGDRYHHAPMSGDIFAVIGTGYTVLLAFVIFTALASYQNARDSTQNESVAVRELYTLTAYFPDPGRTTLQGDLVCYARAVVFEEWPRMADGGSSPRVDAWVASMNRDLQTQTVDTATETNAFGTWFSRAAERQHGRQSRLTESAPYVPIIVWVMIVLLFVVVVGYQILFADRNAPLIPQLLGVVAVSATLLAGIVIVFVLDAPFADRGARITPSRMRNTELVLEADYRSHNGPKFPCDAEGRSTS
jgi:hypothetical protein